MNKILFALVLLLTLLVVPQETYAADRVSQASAELASTTQSVDVFDPRISALRKLFKKYDSPLVDQASSYIRYADTYGVDWRLLPAISGVESTFGNAIPQGSYNAYGWGNGTIYFASWEEGIKIIEQALKQNYIGKGATDVWSIGPIYAESPTWAVRVMGFMQEIDEEFQKLSTLTSATNI